MPGKRAATRVTSRTVAAGSSSLGWRTTIIASHSSTATVTGTRRAAAPSTEPYRRLRGGQDLGREPKTAVEPGPASFQPAHERPAPAAVHLPAGGAGAGARVGLHQHLDQAPRLSLQQSRPAGGSRLPPLARHLGQRDG